VLPPLPPLFDAPVADCPGCATILIDCPFAPEPEDLTILKSAMSKAAPEDREFPQVRLDGFINDRVFGVALIGS
jgi:hypothetical protein